MDSSMSAQYEKGFTPEGGIPYEKLLHTLFAVGGFQHFSEKNWELCNEDKKCGKFDDLIFRIDSECILVQAKSKKNFEIRDQILLTSNPKKDDFSIAKYFLCYKTEIEPQLFVSKYLILCTNANIKISFAEKQKETDGGMIEKIFENCVIYSFKSSDEKLQTQNIQKIKNTILAYQTKLEKEHEYYDKWHNFKFEDQDIETFLEKFICLYAKDGNIKNTIQKKLDAVNEMSTFGVSSFKYVLDQIQDWYNTKSKKACYMTNLYIKSILYGETNKKLIESLLDETITFKKYESLDNYKFFHIKPGEIHRLYLKKILLGLWMRYKEAGKSKDRFFDQILLLNTSSNIKECEEIINCFNVPKFKFLVLVMPEAAENISITIENFQNEINKKDLDKKIITLSNTFPFIDTTSVQTINTKIQFSNLNFEIQERFLEKELYFQGKPFNLRQINTNSISLDELIDECIIENLMDSRKFKIGKNLKNLDSIKDYYISRKLNKINEYFTEDDILIKCKESTLVICDQPGTGKSTLLVKLANDWKQLYPNHWVINLDLGITLKYINENGASSRLTDLLNLHEKCDSPFEQRLIKILKKIILLDGVDEVSSLDRTKLFNFFQNISRSDDIVKIVISTRSYSFILEEIKSFNNLDMVTLEELTPENQIEFFKKYFKHQFNIDHVENSKKFVETCPLVLKHFLNIPLYTKMIADIFSDQIIYKTNQDQSTINITNTYELFKLFMDKKKEIFVRNKFDCGSNSVLYNILCDTFDRYIEDLQIQAIRSNFGNHSISKLLDVDPFRKIKDSVLYVGILEGFKDPAQTKIDYRFIHKTFEEYFVALNIWNNIKERGANKEKLEQIRSEVFLNIEKINICHFIDCILETEDTEYLQDLSIMFSDLVSHIEPKEILSLASQGSVNILKLLFDNSSNFSNILNLKGKYGESVLLMSAHHLPTVKYLVKKKANVGSKDKNGFTALHYATTRFSSFENFELQVSALSKSLLYKDMLFHMNSVQSNLYKFTEIDNYLKRPPSSDSQKGLILQRYADDFKDIVEYFKEERLDLDSKTKIGTTVLQYIAYCGLAKEFKCLVDAGASLETTDWYGNNIVHYAVLGGSMEIIQYLSTTGLLDKENINGVAPIHFTPIGNSVEVLQFLVEHDVDIETEDSYGRTVLFYVNSATSLALVKEIVEHDKNIYRRSKTDMNYTALHMASYTNALDVVEFLINEFGLELVRDKLGQLPIHYAAEGDAVKVLKYFQNTIQPISKIVDDSGASVLHVAAIGNSINAVIYLVEEVKVDPLIKDSSGKSPLHYAAGSGSLEVLKYFVNRKVDVNTVDGKGATVLHYAASNRSLNVLKYIIEETDINIDKEDFSGKHAIHYASEKDFLDGVKYFINKGIKADVMDSIDNTILHYSALGRSAATIKYIFENYRELYRKNKYSRFPIHCAAEGNSAEPLKYLAENDCDIDILLNENVTLLHLASRTNSIEIVKYLLDNYSMILKQDENGKYPFHYAAEGDAIDVIKYFKEKNIRMDGKDRKGRTVVHLAASKNSVEALFYFKEKLEISFKNPDHSGMLPLHHAAAANGLNAIKFLLSLDNWKGISDIDYNNLTVLHWCAFGNAADAFKYFVEDCNSSDVFSEDRFKRQPIHVAVQHDAINVVKYIMENLKIETNLLDKNGNNLLHWAFKFDSIKVFRYFIEEQKMDYLFEKKLPPIKMAVKQGKIMEFLNLSKNKKR